MHCLQVSEARVLDEHIDGYMSHGIGVRPGDVVLDVGANIGLFGLRMAQRCGGDIRLLAFEPIPAIRFCAEKNLSAWEGATVLPYGVGRRAGRASFTYFPNAPSLSTSREEDWKSQHGAFEEAVAGNTQHAPMWYARLVPRILAGPIARYLQSKREQVDCEIVTIPEVLRDHDISRVDLLKIDCEGAEEDALLGIDGDTWAGIQQVVVEVHDIDGRLDRVVALLRAKGLTQLVVEKEEALAKTRLSNVYAHRPRDP